MIWSASDARILASPHCPCASCESPEDVLGRSPNSPDELPVLASGLPACCEYTDDEPVRDSAGAWRGGAATVDVTPENMENSSRVRDGKISGGTREAAWLRAVWNSADAFSK